MGKSIKPAKTCNRQATF